MRPKITSVFCLQTLQALCGLSLIEPSCLRAIVLVFACERDGMRDRGTSCALADPTWLASSCNKGGDHMSHQELFLEAQQSHVPFTFVSISGRAFLVRYASMLYMYLVLPFIMASAAHFNG